MYKRQDTDSIETAKNVWRMTEGGFGFSSNGFNGPFELAITMDGKINASFILVGELLANLIKTGRIQSQTGTVYFDSVSYTHHIIARGNTDSFFSSLVENSDINAYTVNFSTDNAKIEDFSVYHLTQ